MGFLFVNVLINDIFRTIDKSSLCNYADNNTLYISGNDPNTVISKLNQDLSKIFKWFYERFMILNPDKCYFLTLGFQDAQPNFSYDNITIKNVSEEKILDITINNKLTFKRYLKNICKKVNQIFNGLVRITKFTSSFQRKILLNSFIKSQFSYCPLISMFASKELNKMINRIHEKSLRLVLNNHHSTLDEMLDSLNEKTIHQYCIDRLLTKVYVFLNGSSPDIMNDVLQLRKNTCNLRNFLACANDVSRSNCMLNSIIYRANQLWEILPFDLKNSCLPELFKKDP